MSLNYVENGENSEDTLKNRRSKIHS